MELVRHFSSSQNHSIKVGSGFVGLCHDLQLPIILHAIGSDPRRYLLVHPIASNIDKNLGTNFESIQSLDILLTHITLKDVFCKHCLAKGHTRKDCLNSIKCSFCYNYGRDHHHCLAKQKSRKKSWV